MRHPPQLAKTTQVLEWNTGRQRRRLDELAAEEPLEIFIDDVPVGITMRTPGDDFDLAAGLLLSEGLIEGRDQLVRIAYGVIGTGESTGNRVVVTLTAGGLRDTARLERRTMPTSSCGICGKASIDAVRASGIPRLRSQLTVTPQLLMRLPGSFLPAQRVFGRTGGLHAAALFDDRGALLSVREDIGRHNAVDKVIGHALLEGEVPLSNRILLVSGRGGFEIVQKALAGGVPVLACVSAPSSLAVQLARDYGLTLIGFLRGRRFIVYSGEDRLRLGTPRKRARSLT